MSKKDIGKILTSGSTKQKLLIIAEDIARGKYFQDRILTDSEFNQLSDSFKKTNEIKEWNQWRRIDDTVTNAIVNLQGLLYEVKMRYSDLRGYILTWSTIEQAEILVNSVLLTIKDKEERKTSAYKGVGIDLLFSKTILDEEGFLDLKIDYGIRDEGDPFIDKKPKKTKNLNLLDVMNNVKEEIEKTVIKYLSWEIALLDYMEEKGFNVKTYKDRIKDMTIQVYTPLIGWMKYYGVNNAGGFSHKRMEKVFKEYYSICPKVEDLKIDEVEYNFFRKQIIGDE